MTTKHTVLGIDTGGTTTRIWSGIGSIQTFDTPRDYNDYLNIVGQEVRKANATIVVIGVPAIVEKHQKVVAAVNLGKNWSGKDLAADMGERTGAEVFIVQDTEAAGYTLQEQIDNESDAMLITLSTGVGGAWVSKELVKPLEVGHIPLDLSGQSNVCSCAQTGCVEADIGGWAVRKIHGPAENINDLDFWTDYGTKVGRFFLSLTTLFRLEQIALMGGISRKWTAFEAPCLEYLRAHLKHVPLPNIRIMDDSENVGVRGAYYLGRSGALPSSQKGINSSISEQVR